MSVCPSFIECGGEITLEQVMKNLFLKDENGCIYLNVRQTVITADDCDSLTPAIECGGEITLLQLLLQAITVDECGNATLNTISQETDITDQQDAR